MKLTDWIKGVKAYCSAATPGPWVCKPRDCSFYPEHNGKLITQESALAWDDNLHLQAHLSGPKEPWGRGDFTVRDAWFIASARTDLEKAMKLIEAMVPVVEAAIRETSEEHLRESHSNDHEECCIDGSLFDAVRDYKAVEEVLG